MAYISTAPEGAYCVEEGCGFHAQTTRPIDTAWLTEQGVADHHNGREWVCWVHSDKEFK